MWLTNLQVVLATNLLLVELINKLILVFELHLVVLGGYAYLVAWGMEMKNESRVTLRILDLRYYKDSIGVKVLAWQVVDPRLVP